MYRNERIWDDDEDFDSVWSRYTSPQRRKKKKPVPVTPNYWEAQPEFAALVRTHIPSQPTRRMNYLNRNPWGLDESNVGAERTPWGTVRKTPAKLYGDNGIYRFTTPQRAERNLDIVGRSIHAETFRRSLANYQSILDERQCTEFNDMWRETFDSMIAKDLEFLAETTLKWERLLKDIERRHGINWGLSRLVWAA